MKSIKLETTKESIMIQGKLQEVELSDKQILLEVLNTPFEQGTKPSEMRQRLSLIDKVEKAEDEIEFEDHDFTTIKGFVENFSFGIVSKRIVAFADKFS